MTPTTGPDIFWKRGSPSNDIDRLSYKHKFPGPSCYSSMSDGSSTQCLASSSAGLLGQAPTVCQSGFFLKQAGDPSVYQLGDDNRLHPLCGPWTSPLFTARFGVTSFNAVYETDATRFATFEASHRVTPPGIYPDGQRAPVCGDPGYACGDFRDPDGCFDLHCGSCSSGPSCPEAKNCGGRSCGSDPICGESCGTCSGGRVCENGSCACPTDGCPDGSSCIRADECASRTCTSGVCSQPSPSCSDDCAPPDWCPGPITAGQCGHFDSDPCLDWRASTCAVGTVCAEGECVACGDAGEPCCAEETCAGSLTCQSGSCSVPSSPSSPCEGRTNGDYCATTLQGYSGPWELVGCNAGALTDGGRMCPLGCTIVGNGQDECVPTCFDGLENGAESDLDCGHVCPSLCVTGQACEEPSDCVSANCVGGRCAPSCTRASCEGLHTECGDVSDGCGGVLHCGGCAAPLNCGGSGTANHCGLCQSYTTRCANGVSYACAPDGRSETATSCPSGACASATACQAPSACAYGACDIKFDPNNASTVLIRAAAFHTNGGRPLTELLAANSLCGIAWASPEPFNHHEFAVRDANTDGWVEFPIPTIRAGAAPYRGCPSCADGGHLPFRFTVRRCDPATLTQGEDYISLLAGSIGDFYWAGTDDVCNAAWTLALSWDGTRYWASGTATSGVASCQR